MMGMVMALHAEQIEFSEAYLGARFSRAAKAPEAITYEFTRDPGFLHQYYRLRDQLFFSVWGLAALPGAKDEYDERSDVLVARVGNLVIGGYRLTYNYPGTNRNLPMEKNGFSVRDALPDMRVDEVMSAEISSLAILPEYRSASVIAQLFRELSARCVQKKLRYAFSAVSFLQAQGYRKMGVEFDVRKDIAVPSDGDVNLVLSMLDFAPAKPSKAKSLRLLADA